ncbi:MAG: lysophospholipid acyltransferase family protein [Candidatus Omnitrophica bacterium]|nr:lysophospholipid acyltransferase family protein [Candidatus Omnitrophota bacterium]
MVLRYIRRRFDALFARVVLEIGAAIVYSMPPQRLSRVARGLGNFLYAVLYRQRRTAYNGLERAFGGQKSPAERRRIVHECFVNMAKCGVELLSWVGHAPYARRSIRFQNLAVLDRALAKGKGVILVSGHFGNFPLILVRLALEGYKTSVIMRPIKEMRLIRMFDSARRRMDIETVLTIPRISCVSGSIRSLRSNRVMLLPIDQNFGTGGVFVDFFGTKAATATGPVVLAQRTGAAIVPCFIVRQKDDTHTVIFEPEFSLRKGDNEHETIVRSVQALTDIIESYIRRYPEQWTWIHRRWKARPRPQVG